MPTTIQKLLKKKGWTGAELGKLLVASYLNDIKKAKGTAKRDLFTQAEFQAMADTITDNYENQVLSVYNSLLSGIGNAFTESKTMEIAFGDSYNRYNMGVLEIEKTERAKEKLELMPFIVTKEQYDRLVSAAKNKDRSLKDTYAGIVFEVLKHCLDAEEDSKAKPKAIMTALEKTKTIAPEQCGFCYKAYNEALRHKEWVMPDGQRVSTDKKEAQEALLKMAPRIRGYEKRYADKKAELFFYGAEATRAFLRELTGNEPPQTDKQLEDIVRSTIDAEYLEDSYLIALIAPCLGAKLQKRELPKDLTLYDILPAYWEKLLDADEQEHKEILDTFKKEVPDVFSAIADYISGILPETKNIKPKDYGKELFTWGELVDASIYGYKKLVATGKNYEIAQLYEEDEDGTDSAEKVQIRKRIITSGLAIAVDPPKRSIDKNGDFINLTFLFDGFDSLDKLEKDDNAKKAYRQRREDGIKLACKMLYAHNALMDILEDVYAVPELAEVTKSDTAEIEEQIDLQNQIIYALHAEAYGTEEEKAKKRQLVKEVFEPINIEELKPKQEDIDSVAKEIKRLGFSAEARHELKNLTTNYVNRLSQYKG